VHTGIVPPVVLCLLPDSTAMSDLSRLAQLGQSIHWLKYHGTLVDNLFTACSQTKNLTESRVLVEPSLKATYRRWSAHFPRTRSRHY
jgi:hypothetical protein